MNKTDAKNIKYLLQDIEYVESQLRSLESHSFWFWRNFDDIDSFLRPLANLYLENKYHSLMNALDRLKLTKSEVIPDTKENL